MPRRIHSRCWETLLTIRPFLRTISAETGGIVAHGQDRYRRSTERGIKPTGRVMSHYRSNTIPLATCLRANAVRHLTHEDSLDAHWMPELQFLYSHHIGPCMISTIERRPWPLFSSDEIGIWHH